MITPGAYRRADPIGGRSDDALNLRAGHGGPFRIHPVFHQVLDLLGAASWQARQRGTALEVLVAAARPGFRVHATEGTIQAAAWRNCSTCAGI